MKDDQKDDVVYHPTYMRVWLMVSLDVMLHSISSVAVSNISIPIVLIIHFGSRDWTSNG